MRAWKWNVVLTIALMVASAAVVAGEVEDKLRATLGERLPGIRIESVTKLSQLDLYEVVRDGNRIFYTDAKGEYALVGNLMDQGAPRLVFSNGKLVPGAISAEEIERYLSAPGKS
jgi:hypothetical protein